MNHPKSNLLQLAIPYYRMQTQMFDNALANISEVEALKRIDNKTNHLIWIAGNMVNCRYWLASVLGIEKIDPNEDLFKDAKALDSTANYPRLETLKSEWHHISPVLYERLINISDEELHEKFDFGMGVSFVEENNLNMVGMALDRVSYLLGQVGIIRKILGLEAMKYDMNDSIHY